MHASRFPLTTASSTLATLALFAFSFAGCDGDSGSMAGGPPPTIVSVSDDVTVEDGSSAVLMVRAAGSGSLGYSWSVEGTPEGTFDALADGAQLTYATPPLRCCRTLHYRVIVSDDSTTARAVSRTVSVRVAPKPG